uniref:Uncharacterized protein n=1 Tax=Aegilops tauschii subsp. strangulata TaxID=200361 RepID=A0A453MFZ6_AEGTS
MSGRLCGDYAGRFMFILACSFCATHFIGAVSSLEALLSLLLYGTLELQVQSFSYLLRDKIKIIK